MVVVHSYKNGYGGLGDLLRSMFAYFVFCKMNGIEEYYLDFSETNLKYCFDNVSPITGPKSRKLTNTRVMIQIGSTTTQDTKKNLEILKKEGSVSNKVFIIYSNIFDFIEVSELKKHTASFLEFLCFSEKVKTRASELISEILNVDADADADADSKRDYVGIHVRCGDAHMEKTNIQSDSRITPNSSVNKIDVAIEFLKTNTKDKDVPIILFTDNTNLKKKSIILGIHTLNDTVYHTSIPTSNEKEVEGLIDSVAEFLLLSGSKCNVSITDSGFSYWSSFLGSVPLYRVNEKNVIEVFDKLKY